MGWGRIEIAKDVLKDKDRSLHSFLYLPYREVLSAWCHKIYNENKLRKICYIYLKISNFLNIEAGELHFIYQLHK